MSVLKTENLTKVYKRGWKEAKTALDSLSIEVHEGEVFGFLGPNGAGKTTTIKILLRLLTPTTGSAQILGKDLRNAPTRLRVGYMPENPYFYRFLTGEEFLKFYAKLNHIPADQRDKRIDELLNTVGMTHARAVRIRDYSKGMVQRIGLAQALMHDPKLVLLDEPLSGLDPIGRKEIRDLVYELKKQGRTIFFCSHILSEAIAPGLAAGRTAAHLAPVRVEIPAPLVAEGFDACPKRLVARGRYAGLHARPARRRIVPAQARAEMMNGRAGLVELDIEPREYSIVPLFETPVQMRTGPLAAHVREEQRLLAAASLGHVGREGKSLGIADFVPPLGDRGYGVRLEVFYE